MERGKKRGHDRVNLLLETGLKTDSGLTLRRKCKRTTRETSQQREGFDLQLRLKD